MVGHTCKLGPDDVNYIVGLGRAKSVRDVLVAAGLDADQIFIRSAGSAEPITTNSTETGRIQNRRVVVACRGE